MPPTTAAVGGAHPARVPSPLGLTALFADALELLRRYPGALLAPLVALAAVTNAGWPAWTPDDVAGDPFRVIPYYGILGALAVIVLLVLFVAYTAAWLVTSRAALEAIEGQDPPALGDALRGLRADIVPATVTFLAWLALVSVGLLLFVVPGLLVLAALFPLAAVVAAERVFGVEAMRRAWRVSRGHRGVLFGLVLLSGAGLLASTLLFAWIPIVGPALSGAAMGAVYAFAICAAALFYARAKAHAHVPVVAAPTVLRG